MSAKWVRILVITTYCVIGGYIAWDHGYLGLGLIRSIVSAVLAIVLWWLIPLGANLHLHN